MSVHFEGKKGGKPFPRTAEEWMEKGYSAEQASRKMHEDVFGQDYTTNAKGEPIEKGKGSAAQPTPQHQNALMMSQEAELARKMRLGWHPGMEQVFEPSPKARRRKKRKTAAAPAEGNA